NVGTPADEQRRVPWNVGETFATWRADHDHADAREGAIDIATTSLPEPTTTSTTTSPGSRGDRANLIRAGVLRYIQNTYERRPWRTPAFRAAHWPDADPGREADRDVARHGIGCFRRKDFYNYLLLRTLCYDDVFRRSISEGVGQIVIIGAGTD